MYSDNLGAMSFLRICLPLINGIGQTSDGSRSNNNGNLILLRFSIDFRMILRTHTAFAVPLQS